MSERAEVEHIARTERPDDGTTAHDPGGRSRLPLLAGMEGSARFEGENGEHRLWLERRETGAGECDYALWLCMNPSTAGADEDDPLVRKVWEFTRRTGPRRFVLVNALSYRLTDSTMLKRMDASTLVHEHNLDTVGICAANATRIVAATGVPPRGLEVEFRRALDRLTGRKAPVECLGRTKEGWPRHPGRLGYDTPLEPFNAASLP